MLDIARTRLHAQRLAGIPFSSPVETVGRMGAVQSQDLAGAKWALGLRTPGVTESQVDRLFDGGAILRTHVMRPTWHFVLPKDIRWMLELTGARIRAGAAGRYRRLEIDDRVVARAEAVFERALLGGRHLTRAELGDALRAAGIAPEGQRLPHLLMAAELRGLLASGLRRGKQMTWALLEERVPAAPSRPRDEAVADLVFRYFATHGPAQLQDFVWWSGLTMADARAGIAVAGDTLARREMDDRKYWFDARAASPGDVDGTAHLLPNFDEYTVAYRDRAAQVRPDRPLKTELFAFGSILANVLTVGGRVHGSWRKTVARGRVKVQVRLLDERDRALTAAIGDACAMLGRFLEAPVDLSFL